MKRKNPMIPSGLKIITSISKIPYTIWLPPAEPKKTLMSAVTGCFYASYLTYIAPVSTASFDLSMKIGVVAIVGGVASHRKVCNLQ